MTPDELTAYLHQHIPLTAALAARVLRCGEGEIEILAPLAPNLNHRGTAFGGSLATLGILAGWAVLHLALRGAQRKDRLVIQSSNAEFLEPVNAEFTAVSRVPAKEWPRFIKTLERHGRARITVSSEISSASQRVMTHAGTYVALAGGYEQAA